jgi:hypothetical protein
LTIADFIAEGAIPNRSCDRQFGMRSSIRNPIVNPKCNRQSEMQSSVRNAIVNPKCNRESEVQSSIGSAILNPKCNCQSPIDNALVSLQSAIGQCSNGLVFSWLERRPVTPEGRGFEWSIRQPALTLANVRVSYGWQARRRLSTNIHQMWRVIVDGSIGSLR